MYDRIVEYGMHVWIRPLLFVNIIENKPFDNARKIIKYTTIS